MQVPSWHNRCTHALSWHNRCVRALSCRSCCVRALNCRNGVRALSCRHGGRCSGDAFARMKESAGLRNSDKAFDGEAARAAIDRVRTEALAEQAARAARREAKRAAGLEQVLSCRNRRFHVLSCPNRCVPAR